MRGRRSGRAVGIAAERIDEATFSSMSSENVGAGRMSRSRGCGRGATQDRTRRVMPRSMVGGCDLDEGNRES